MNGNSPKSFGAKRWNACLDVLSRPLEELNVVQRPAALAFHYYGRVMNGGHLQHFDYKEDELDDELLAALSAIGASQHAEIFAEVLRRWRRAKNATETERDAEEVFIESVLDDRFYALQPDMLEVLANYFAQHLDSFPK